MNASQLGTGAARQAAILADLKAARLTKRELRRRLARTIWLVEIRDGALARLDTRLGQLERSLGRGAGSVPDGHRFPPRPDDSAGWAEWIRCGGPQPSVCRGADGATEWLADALHLGGNGLVPQAAREAWRQLVNRLQS